MLPSRLMVDLLRRATAARGGFAVVVLAGDDQRGSILVQCRDRQDEGPLLEYDPRADRWIAVGPAIAEPASVRADYLARRRRIDPDLWLVELDSPDAAQFVAALSQSA